ncbi:hypothetical protein CL633_03135 [bacterium]|nr:hypothetical protein [bacterium]|tara:strand:+ start:6594 stop:7382 length:789 start_codon:yes stop_codon:yes gene_type:complete
MKNKDKAREAVLGLVSGLAEKNKDISSDISKAINGVEFSTLKPGFQQRHGIGIWLDCEEQPDGNFHVEVALRDLSPSARPLHEFYLGLVASDGERIAGTPQGKRMIFKNVPSGKFTIKNWSFSAQLNRQESVLKQQKGNYRILEHSEVPVKYLHISNYYRDLSNKQIHNPEVIKKGRSYFLRLDMYLEETGHGGLGQWGRPEEKVLALAGKYELELLEEEWTGEERVKDYAYKRDTECRGLYILVPLKDYESKWHQIIMNEW